MTSIEQQKKEFQRGRRKLKGARQSRNDGLNRKIDLRSEKRKNEDKAINCVESFLSYVDREIGIETLRKAIMR